MRTLAYQENRQFSSFPTGRWTLTPFPPPLAASERIFTFIKVLEWNNEMKTRTYRFIIGPIVPNEQVNKNQSTISRDDDAHTGPI